MTQGAVFTALPDRAFIIIKGSDREAFLQGLITQDIHLLDTHPLIYACFLTAQGKYLYDFFIRREDDTLILDCEGGDRAQSLLKCLSMYKLRSDVTLELHDNAAVWQVFHTETPHKEFYKDPRHPSCGHRAYSHPSSSDLIGGSPADKDPLVKPKDDVTLKETSFEQWDVHRIRLEIPDGSRDLIPEKSFIHEGRLDELNAVSYTKGCYVGQELVSRMHHRGLTKKVLKCVDVNALPERAELRSTCNDVGLALIRLL